MNTQTCFQRNFQRDWLQFVQGFSFSHVLVLYDLGGIELAITRRILSFNFIEKQRRFQYDLKFSRPAKESLVFDLMR